MIVNVSYYKDIITPSLSVLIVHVRRVVTGGPTLAVRRLITIVRGRRQVLGARHGVQLRLVFRSELQNRLQMPYIPYSHPAVHTSNRLEPYITGTRAKDKRWGWFVNYYRYKISFFKKKIIKLQFDFGSTPVRLDGTHKILKQQ